MWKTITIALLATLTVLPLPAADLLQPLTGKKYTWSPGGGSDKTKVTLDQRGDELVATVSTTENNETFPHLSLGIAEPEDWRCFNRLEFDIRLTSETKDIMDNGKKLCICLYDNTARHMNIEGHPQVQQNWGDTMVDAGEWQHVSLDLTDKIRRSVGGLGIFFYNMPYGYPHSLQFEIRNVRLRGAGGQVFDRVGYDPEQLAAANTPDVSAGSVHTDNGFGIELGKNGSICRIGFEDNYVFRGNTGLTGVWVRDFKAGTAPVRLGGTWSFENGEAVQTSELPDLALRATVRYTPEKDFIRVHGEIESLNSEDRAVTVYAGIPMPYQQNLEISTSLLEIEKPYQVAEKMPQFECSVGEDYPCATLTYPDRHLSIGAAIDMGIPVLYRFIANPRFRTFFAAYDLGLVDIKNCEGKSLRRSSFDLLLYPADWRWGMRSALESYYRHFPDYFADRVGTGGAFSHPSFQQKLVSTAPEKIIEGGFRFVWGANGYQDDNVTWRWNYEHGCFNLMYTEPEYIQFSMGDFDMPTVADTVARMDRLIADDEEEWAKFSKLHYYQNNAIEFPGDRLRPITHAMIAAARASGMYDRNGDPIMNLGNRVGWIGDKGIGTMIPCNLAPAIPNGRAQYLFDYYQGRCDKYKALGMPAGGFNFDSFMCMTDDYCRDHFQYMTTALGFDTEGRVMVPHSFGTFEWLRELGRRFRPEKQVFMANFSGRMVFLSSELDIFGIENTNVPHPELLRSLAGPSRPISYLLYGNPTRSNLEVHAGWGIYAGGEVDSKLLAPFRPILDDMYRAGWAPVPYARASQTEVRVERFGAPGAEAIYFSFSSTADQPVTAQISFDTKELGIKDNARLTMLYPESGKVIGNGRTAEITIAPDRCVLAVMTPGDGQ